VPPRSSHKLVNPNQANEDLGLIFIQKVAYQIGAIWRPTPNHDYGLDGELELTSSGVVTGTIIKAQLKSGRSYLKNRNKGGFTFYVDPSDAGYWRGANFPVILVVYDPDADAGYWIDVKRYLNEHAHDPSPNAVRFSHTRNALSRAVCCFSSLRSHFEGYRDCRTMAAHFGPLCGVEDGREH
jgi:hypothetical protein